MKKIIPAAIITALTIGLYSCGHNGKSINPDSHTSADDSLSRHAIQTDSLMNRAMETGGKDNATAADSDSVKVEKAANVPPGQDELKKLMDHISARLQNLEPGNPLGINIYAMGITADAVEVALSVNTPYFRDMFRRLVSDSPFVKFEGPTSPQKIDIVVRADFQSDSISLSSDSDSFPADAEKVPFTLANDSEKTLTFGVDYIVGYQGDDGVWYRLPNPGIWNDLGISMKKGGRHSFEVSLHPRLNNNRPGTYRLYKKLRFEDEKDYFWIMTEFRLD